MTCGNNMAFTFFYPYSYISPSVSRDSKGFYHDRSTCEVCQKQDKQIAALKVHCLSRSFQYRTRCGE